MELLDSLSSGTTGRKRVNEQKLLNLCISLPPLTEQNKLISKQIKVDETMDCLFKELNFLKEKVIEDLQI